MPYETGTIGDFMDAIEAALSVDMTDFDFSVDGRIKRGRYLIPPRLPFIGISNPRITAPDGAPLGAHENQCSVVIEAFAASPGGNLDQRCRDSLALLHRVIEALDTARTTPGSGLHTGHVRSWRYDTGTSDGERDEIPADTCCASVQLVFVYNTRVGL